MESEAVAPPAPWLSSTDELLEQGGTYEILPEQLHLLVSAAHRYLRADHPQEAKDRVKAVWIDKQHQPAWRAPQKKIPDLRPKMPLYNQPEPETDFG